MVCSYHWSLYSITILIFLLLIFVILNYSRTFSSAYLRMDGKDGKDGQDGKDGKDVLVSGGGGGSAFIISAKMFSPDTDSDCD